MSDVTPARAVREGFRWAWAAVILSLLLVAVFLPVSLFVWHIGGVFQQKSIQRNFSNTVHSQAYQASLLAQMQQNLENITGPGGLAATRAGLPASSPEQQVLRAQELNELQQLCAESARFDPQSVPGGQQVQAVVSANCAAGVPLAAPPLAGPVP
jgi:hypothetical protein